MAEFTQPNAGEPDPRRALVPIIPLISRAPTHGFGFEPADKAADARAPRKSIYHGSLYPEGFLDHLTGVRESPVIMVRPREPSPKNVFMYMRLRQDDPAKPGTWYVVRRPTAFEITALGRSRKPIKISSGFKEGEEVLATAFFVLQREIQRNVIIARMMPGQVSVAAMLHSYLDHLETSIHKLSENTVAAYTSYMSPLNADLGHEKLGAIDERRLQDYVKRRRRQSAANGGRHRRRKNPRPVSMALIRAELVLFRAIVRRFGEKSGVQLDVHLPEFHVLRPPVTWLTREQFVRYLLALRGRIWNAETGDWRRRRDDAEPDGARGCAPGPPPAGDPAVPPDDDASLLHRRLYRHPALGHARHHARRCLGRHHRLGTPRPEPARPARTGDAQTAPRGPAHPALGRVLRLLGEGGRQEEDQIRDPQQGG